MDPSIIVCFLIFIIGLDQGFSGSKVLEIVQKAICDRQSTPEAEKDGPCELNPITYKPFINEILVNQIPVETSFDEKRASKGAELAYHNALLPNECTHIITLALECFDDKYKFDKLYCIDNKNGQNSHYSKPQFCLDIIQYRFTDD